MHYSLSLKLFRFSYKDYNLGNYLFYHLFYKKNLGPLLLRSRGGRWAGLARTEPGSPRRSNAPWIAPQEARNIMGRVWTQ